MVIIITYHCLIIVITHLSNCINLYLTLSCHSNQELSGVCAGSLLCAPCFGQGSTEAIGIKAKQVGDLSRFQIPHVDPGCPKASFSDPALIAHEFFSLITIIRHGPSQFEIGSRGSAATQKNDISSGCNQLVQTAGGWMHCFQSLDVRGFQNILHHGQLE